MKQVDWYFDLISPFAYLASESLVRLPDNIELRPRPLLFAGLLQHWQTKGPAEIEPMRRFTFRHICWLAERKGIPLCLPPAHPFNPLKLLRLCIAMGSERAVIQQLFRFVWAEGRTADHPDDWQELIEALGLELEYAEQLIASPEIKDRLKQNTEESIAKGLFGVPSFLVDGEIFWGYDAIDFLVDYLDDPDLLCSPQMQSADMMPVGLQRQALRKRN